MKFLASIAVYLVISAALVLGILALMAGKPLLLVASVLIYLGLFARIGCASH